MPLFCARCQRNFRTSDALNQHRRNSSFHHECPNCDFDATSWEELLQHCRETGCRTACQGCNDGDGELWDWTVNNQRKRYWRHVRRHNVCTDCERHFETPNSLEQHKITHRTADYECLVCDRSFKTYSGMILHLESGACESGHDIIDVNEAAATCDTHHCVQFLDHHYRQAMLARQDLEEIYNEPVYPYECPRCDTFFTKASSLFQHVESSVCVQILDDKPIGALRRSLESWLG
ncbi:hypothetical protein M011DRAFT_220004 [Sporormia fimetaria CBS 119925]|uniref:C2H2-type domain-containing protein n=1 Tax=Sporormia fimetaria CBS 119925 TaxID=1340428 RepID=A0A6A6UZA4_9PLEO|nr:hypothetical protein M011DRAFT_220004 [Sporormia fimetaria CBS 119925]